MVDVILDKPPVDVKESKPILRTIPKSKQQTKLGAYRSAPTEKAKPYYDDADALMIQQAKAALSEFDTTNPQRPPEKNDATTHDKLKLTSDLANRSDS